MNVVYEAENPRLGSIVALKMLAPELATNDAFRTRFLKESRIATTAPPPASHSRVLRPARPHPLRP
jgi:serine/threonine-protein kinase